MQITIKESANQYLVSLQGELDTAASIEAKSTLQPLHECQGKEIILDCTQLEYIASSGLRLFLALMKDAKANGNHLIVSHLNDDILSVFKMTGFIELFEIQ
ncbi:MAG: STAS domain-containing protein [Bacteroidaceae bacterium]|jgi:anti-sigma B factor antagonist|nr:STAS domain-containing protein [Bacteroidaceae bacterium]